MIRLGIDKLEVQAVFKRTQSLSGMLKKKDDNLIACLANAVGEVIEENNKKLYE